MRNRGLLRGWVFVGGFLLVAAVLVWAIGVVTGIENAASDQQPDPVGATLVFQRNFAVATVVLSAAAAILLFLPRRPHAPKWDLAIGLLIALLIGSSLYQLATL